MSTFSIKYLRHGIVHTGGARHEEFFMKSLKDALRIHHPGIVSKNKIAASIFRGWANLRLILWGFFQADADVNIVVGRLALSSILRNLFSRSKTIIVFHNFDENDGKSLLLKKYYETLFNILKRSSGKRVSIVAVSPYFQRYFSQRFPKLKVFLFPNLFEADYYTTFKQERNPNKILLGQYSSKMDASIYRLAERLTKAGYQCFFCTLREEEAGSFENYDVKKLSFENYLNEMASSYCSLSLSGVNEGWPRMVHESILVGTPVIGYDMGGLGDLLKESGSYIAKDENEAFDLITGKKLEYKTSLEFIRKYDISSVKEWITPIINYFD